VLVRLRHNTSLDKLVQRETRNPGQPLHACSRSTSGPTLYLLLLPRLLEYLIAGMERGAWSEHWTDIQQQLLPLHNLALQQPLIRNAPEAFVTLVRSLLCGTLPCCNGGNNTSGETVYPNKKRSPSVQCLYSVGCLAQDIADRLITLLGEGVTSTEAFTEMMQLQHAAAQLLAGSASPEKVAEMDLPKVECGQDVVVEAAVSASSSAQASLAAATPSIAVSDEGAGLIIGTSTSLRGANAVTTPHELREMARGILQVVMEIVGGETVLALRLLSLAKEEIAHLTGVNELSCDAVVDGQKLRSITFLLNRTLHTMELDGDNAGELVKQLVESALQGAELPPDRKHIARPLLDVMLCPRLVHRAASELWGQVTASFLPTATVPMQPKKLYAAGCLASEIEGTIEACGDEGASKNNSLKLMWRLQQVAYFHLLRHGSRHVAKRKKKRNEVPSSSRKRRRMMA